MAFGRRETAILICGDLFILIASLWVALLLRNLSVPAIGYFEANLVPFLPIFLLSIGVFYVAGLYEKQTKLIRRVMGPRIANAQAANVALAAIVFFLLPLTIAPKTILVLYLIVSVVAISVWRFHRMKYEIQSEKRELATLYGSSQAARELHDEIQGNGRYLLRFDAQKETAGQERIELHAARGVAVVPLARIYEEVFDRVPIDVVSEEDFHTPLNVSRRVYDVSKRIFDVVLVLLLVPIAIPVTLLAALVLRIESGPPFIRPSRIGKGGKSIRLLKLRSMLFNDNGDPELQKKNQVTPVGRFLRKSRIDELPELWNVLVGDLSFIGPRPEFPKIAETYERDIPHYKLRYLITPGLSGWAQIHDYDAPRGGADVERTKRKLSFDLYYLKHRSFWLDLAIALKTLRALVSLSGT
jgi:lipopolysaccharide/colanic/teichoic acid biosynthesis glycosyltransferase